MKAASIPTRMKFTASPRPQKKNATEMRHACNSKHTRCGIAECSQLAKSVHKSLMSRNECRSALLVGMHAGVADVQENHAPAAASQSGPRGARPSSSRPSDGPRRPTRIPAGFPPSPSPRSRSRTSRRPPTRTGFPEWRTYFGVDTSHAGA
eukprot:5185464-Pleurochrysis_carterae.AAC.4